MVLQNCNCNLFWTTRRWHFSSLCFTHCNCYWEVRKDEFNTHFLNANFVFSEIFFSFEDLSMATQANKMKYRTKYSDELKKQFSIVSKCSSSISDHQYKFHCNVCKLDLSCTSVVLTMLKNMLKHQTTKVINRPLNVSI